VERKGRWIAKSRNWGHVDKVAVLISLLFSLGVAFPAAFPVPGGDVINNHRVILDERGKILPWSGPASMAYDQFLQARWNFIKSKVPLSPGPVPRSTYPQYYFYCAYRDKDGVLEPDTWMNDVGEKIPNWFESARLFYAYSGDASVMRIAQGLADYALEHGTSPSDYPWPNFPYTAANAGDLEFRGFTSAGRLVRHEVQVDHAGDMGLTYYRLFLYTGDRRYLDAAVQIAETLAKYARAGNATQSVWPYRVVVDTGRVTAEYGANWIGCYALLDSLIRAGLGDVRAFEAARDKVRDFLLKYPMKTGYWTDGHTDTAVNSNSYKSNLSASNAKLYMLEHPEFNPSWKVDVPKFIRWTEKYFVLRCAPGEPATQWGANIVGEQDDFLPKMDYQTARYAAECARWYAASGDPEYKEKAYRSLNWVTYCNDPDGKAVESPLSHDISNWWSDCYGECPRMFYQVFAAIPEWAPPGENHILYSEDVIRKVVYGDWEIRYLPATGQGVEYLRLNFSPSLVTVGGLPVSRLQELNAQGYTMRGLGAGDYAVQIRREVAGEVVVRSSRTH